MEWLSNGALPMGLVFFGAMVFGFLRRKAGHVVARRQYPELAARLGVEYRPSRYRTGVGSLSGAIEDFRLTVDPDEGRRVALRFPEAVAVELWSHAHNKRPAAGQRSFRPKDRRTAAFFKTAFGSDEVIALLDGSEIGAECEALGRIRELKSFSVTEGGLTAVFDFGSPPFIPADVVRDVVERMVRIARVLCQKSQ